MLIAAPALDCAVRTICAAAGSEAPEAEAVAAQLVEANLRGHDSHGVGMLPQYIDAVLRGALQPNRHVRTVAERGSILTLDGQWGYGQVIGAEAMAAGIATARATGMALVALRNSHHLGRIGAWAEQCLAAGFVSLHFVNVTGSPPRVAPFGGSDARLGTNPVCVGIPTGGEPFVLDMATSRIAMGKVRVAKNKGEPAPDGCLIDSAGRPTRDPRVLFDAPVGALRPFGDHKGSGLGVVCELLAGALTGGTTIPPGRKRPQMIINNMLSIIVDPGAIGDAAAFRAEVEAVAAWVKASPPAPGTDAVLTAGEPERRIRAQRIRDGVPVDAETWRELLRAAESVGVEAEVTSLAA